MIPLNNHRYALITGIVLAVILAFLMGGSHFYELGLARWFHIVSGVFWIGLLYYFNVVQTPALADAAADKGGPGGAGVTKYVGTPGAVLVPLDGAGDLDRGRLAARETRAFVNAFTLGGGLTGHRRRRLARHDHAAERVGRHLAEPEEDPRYQARERRGEGHAPARPPAWPRA